MRHTPGRSGPPAATGGRIARPERRRSRGQALVELALILPVFLLLFAAGVDLARLFHSEVAIESAARAGALEASIHPTSFVAGAACDATTNRVMCAVLTESTGSSLTISPSDVTVACEPSPCVEALGNRITVNVVGHFSLMTPILSLFTGGSNVTFTQSASAMLAIRPNITSDTPDPTVTPTATPTPTPTGTPGPTPTPTPTPAPSTTPTPSPACFEPVADFNFSPNTGKKKITTFQFTDLSSTTAGCPLTYSWNFGDGAGASSTSTVQNPTHEYQAQGGFTITLVVSNSAGSSTRSKTITVTP